MKIIENHSLLTHNTFKIDVSCNRFFLIENDEDINYLFDNKIFKNKFYILGEGANILFTQNFEGDVIHLKTKGIRISHQNEEEVYLQVSAGESWSNLISYCIENNYYGIENLAGIPGKVGSSPVQNIGAYGVEVKDTIFEVIGKEIPSGKPIRLNNSDCQFAYRDSIFKNILRNKILITEVIFKLSKKPHFTIHYGAIKDEMEKENLPLNLENIFNTITKIRNSKLPDISDIGSAGSFFKNPIISFAKWEALQKQYGNLIHYPVNESQVKLSAGQLIELCGWKGYRSGQVGVFSKHSLILVNYGNGTGKEIVSLYQQIAKSIEAKFGVTIVPEVNIL